MTLIIIIALTIVQLLANMLVVKNDSLESPRTSLPGNRRSKSSPLTWSANDGETWSSCAQILFMCRLLIILGRSRRVTEHEHVLTMIIFFPNKSLLCLSFASDASWLALLTLFSNIYSTPSLTGWWLTFASVDKSLNNCNSLPAMKDI